jgi:hypothetical protein
MLLENTMRMSKYYMQLRKWASLNRVEFSDTKVKSMLIDPRKRFKRIRKSDESPDPDEISQVHYFDVQGNLCTVENMSDDKCLGAIIDDRLEFNS